MMQHYKKQCEERKEKEDGEESGDMSSSRLNKACIIWRWSRCIGIDMISHAEKTRKKTTRVRSTKRVEIQLAQTTILGKRVVAIGTE